MTINKFTGPIFPRHPMNNITPFTYRDGYTFLELIEEMREYVNSTLVEGFNENLTVLQNNFIEALEEFATQNAEALDTLITTNTGLANALQTQYTTFVTNTNALVNAINERVGAPAIVKVALNANKTFAIPLGVPANHIIHVEVAQDAVGGRTLTYPAGWIVEAKTKTDPGAVSRHAAYPVGAVYRVTDRDTVPVFDNRVAIGEGALEDHAAPVGSDQSIVAIGRGAMGDMTSAVNSVAIGTNAMRSGTASLDNVAIGDAALRNVSHGIAGYSSDGGSRNTAIGGNAGRFVTGGRGHVFVGRNAGQNIEGGRGAVAIGDGASAGRCPVGLSGTVENWAPAAQGHDGQLDVVAVGAWALSRNRSLNNVGVGAFSLSNAVNSSGNTALGSYALRRLEEDRFLDGNVIEDRGINGTYVHTGNIITLYINGHNAQLGDVVIFKLTSGESKTYANDDVFARITTVNSGNAVSVYSPISRNASGDARLQYIAKAGTETGVPPFNTAVGSASLAFYNGGTGNNTCVGYNSAVNLKSGGNNVAVGHNALSSGGVAGTNFANNIADTTAIGQGALFRAGNDSNGNTAVGYRALLDMVTGTNNTAVGRAAGQTSPTGTPVTGATNSTTLGAGAPVSGDNQVQLGNSASTTYVFGTVQSRSDVRDKADIADTSLGLGFIESLRPVDYRWDMRDDYQGEPGDGSKKRTRLHHGFIAQEIPEGFGGYQDHTVNGGDDIRTLGYDEFIAPLVKAVQELSAKVAEMESRLV